MEKKENIKADKEQIKMFEEKIKKALAFKYCKEKVYEFAFVLKKIDLLKFLEIYKQSSFYSKECEKNVIDILMDIKLQIFYIFEVEIGQYNRRVYDIIESFKEIPKNDFIFLTKLNIDQNMIYKVRVLWERIMNFVYLIVIEKELKVKKSKITKFRNFLKENSGWNFINKAIEKIEIFDSAFRTPETHKNSTLRKYFLRGENIKIEEYCFNLLEIFINETYPNILKVLKGEKPSIKFWRKMPQPPYDKAYLGKFNEEQSLT